MKTYVQFKVLSTGYIAGTIPPQFNKEHVKLIDLIGSDGVRILDGRLNIDSCINSVHEIWAKHLNKNSIVGFDIIKAERFTDKGRILYSYLQPGYLDNVK